MSNLLDKFTKFCSKCTLIIESDFDEHQNNCENEMALMLSIFEKEIIENKN